MSRSYDSVGVDGTGMSERCQEPKKLCRTGVE